MNIGIRNSDTNGKIHFRNMLIAAVMLISISIQGIYLGFSMYKFDEFSKRIIDQNINIAHQMMLDNVENVLHEAEALFTFAQGNNIISYAKDCLNLQDEKIAASMFSNMERQCAKADIKSNIVTGFLVLGENTNQKSAYYNFEKRELVEYPDFTKKVLEDSGLDKQIYQSLETPLKLSEEQLEYIIDKYDHTAPEYPAFVEFIEQCRNNYVIMDMLSNVIVIAFLDDECFGSGLEDQEDFNFVLYSSSSKKIFDYGKTVSEEYALENDSNDYHIKRTKIRPKDYEAVTVYKKNNANFQRNINYISLASMVGANILVFILICFFERRLMKPIKIFERWMLHAEKEVSVKEKNVSFGKKIVFSLAISCVVPLLLVSFILNWTIHRYGEALIQKYMNTCILQYENAVGNFQADYQGLSTSPAIELIQGYAMNQSTWNLELIQEFETNYLSQVKSLTNYAYMLVTDRNYDILYQTVYSGQSGLFSNIIRQVSASEKSMHENYFFVAENPISNDYVIVYYAPVMYQNEFIGSVIVAIKEPVLNSYMGLLQKNIDYIFVNESGTIFGDERWKQDHVKEKIQNAVGEASQQQSYQSYLIASCKDENFHDVHIAVLVNTEEYAGILDNMLFDGIVIALILPFIIILTAAFLIHVTLVPITGMTRSFSKSENMPEKLAINTGISEINELILVYNGMVERQEELRQENEERHEKEKQLISLQAQTEFRMLQQQLNPHFMFNTLEVINMLAATRNMDDISDIAKALAEILRFSLNRSQEVMVDEEIGSLRNYLFIQNIRFGDRIRFVTDIDEALSECFILKFIIQPLVENAVSHGVCDMLKGGMVEISLKQQENFLVISVADNGKGMTEEDLDKLRESVYDDAEEHVYTTGGGGIGLKNIYRRIRFYYKNEAEMVIESKIHEGTCIKLILPIIPM